MDQGIEKFLSEKCESFMAEVNPEIEKDSEAYVSHCAAFYAGSFVAAGISRVLTTSLQDAIDEIVEGKTGIEPTEEQG
jgi:hypothetical protein